MPDPAVPNRGHEAAGVILAGGLARRMGGRPKALIRLHGRSLLASAIERASPQVGALAVNANADPDAYAAFGLPVLPDPVAGFPGPLAGILAGMRWAAAEGREWLASFPCDAPLFPESLVADLSDAAAGGADVVWAASGGRAHPVFALWRTELADDLAEALEGEGLRKVDRWTARYRTAEVRYPTEPLDPFFNINTPDDLTRAATLGALPELRSEDGWGGGQ